MEVELLKKALKREKLARKDAERILENKSSELYISNQQLQELLINPLLFPEQNPNAVMRYSGKANKLIYTNNPGREIGLFLNNPSNRKFKEKFRQELLFSFEKEVNHQFDMQIESKVIRFLAVPISATNYINIYTANISDLKVTEVRLENITATLERAQEVLKMGSWELNLLSNEVTWSEELFNVFQIDRKKTIPSYEVYINLLHPDDQQDAIDAIDNAIKNNVRYSLIQRVVKNNAKDIYIECIGHIGFNKDGEANRLYGICIDITDKIEAQQVKENFTKKLEEKVNERTKKLLDSERKLQLSLSKEKELGQLKSNFVSTASHQFRTPLTVIQSNVGLLEILANNTNKEDIEKYKKVTGRITSAIKSMTELMDEVLVLGKLTSGNIQYKPEELNMVKFCDKLVKEFNHISTAGRFVNIVLEGHPYTINLDPKLLTHALSNLISNAFKYSVGKNNPELIIHFNPKELVLSVKDYGMGIPEKELSELFQPFFRANNATEISGTGLGLSIAKEYIQINKGIVEVKSTLGEGSCFKLSFKRQLKNGFNV